MEEKDILILGIESSCDETAASVVKNGRYVMSNVISSQIAIHTEYGGVVPEIASRKHIENIDGVIDKALSDAGVTFDDIDAIAVTYGPGLVGALLVGVSEAKALAYALNKPLVGVNHIEGHICANYIQDPNFEPPYVALVVSGGHSHLLYVKNYYEFEILGRTRDDAAGEAFSGFKSAVLNYLNKMKMLKEEINANDVAASFQQAVIEVLTQKTINAAKFKGVTKVAMAGGVSSNSALRAEMKRLCDENGFSLNIPEPIFCTDNGAMIASAGYYEYIKGRRAGLDLNANPNLKLGER